MKPPPIKKDPEIIYYTLFVEKIEFESVLLLNDFHYVK